MPTRTFNSEAEWLALREGYIGSSEIASLFNIWLEPDGQQRMRHIYEAPPEGALHLECLSPYTSSFRIWQEKAGRLAPDFKETERINAGRHLEPALAAWAQQKWPDWKLRKVRRYIEHPTNPGWGVSRDYEIVAPGHPPVEFKNVDYLVFRDNWRGEGEDLTPPLHINLQLQAQIGVGNDKCDHGWIVLCIGGNRLERVRVPRHDASIARIDEAIGMFWEGVRQQAVPNWLADDDTVCRLAALDPIEEGAPPVDLTDDEAARRDLRRFLRWKQHLKFVEGQVDGMKARIGMKMLEGTRATCPDGTVSWPLVTSAAKEIRFWKDAKTYRGGFTVKPPKA